LEGGPRSGMGRDSSWCGGFLVRGGRQCFGFAALKRTFWLAAGRAAAIVPRTMSQHRSLRGQGAIKAKRNVLKRFERVEVLKKRGQFKDGQSVIGLKKTKPDE